MQLAYAVGMTSGSPRQERRREKLRELVESQGGQAQVALDIGTPKSHLSAILAGRRGVGDALAQKIERCYEKSPGWMDGVGEALELPDDVASLAAAINSLPSPARERLIGTIAEIVAVVNEPESQPEGNDTAHEVTKRYYKVAKD